MHVDDVGAGVRDAPPQPQSSVEARQIERLDRQAALAPRPERGMHLGVLRLRVDDDENPMAGFVLRLREQQRLHGAAAAHLAVRQDVHDRQRVLGHGSVHGERSGTLYASHALRADDALLNAT
jgi:hypothetical protein